MSLRMSLENIWNLKFCCGKFSGPRLQLCSHTTFFVSRSNNFWMRYSSRSWGCFLMILPIPPQTLTADKGLTTHVGIGMFCTSAGPTYTLSVNSGSGSQASSAVGSSSAVGTSSAWSNYSLPHLHVITAVLLMSWPLTIETAKRWISNWWEYTSCKQVAMQGVKAQEASSAVKTQASSSAVKIILVLQ